MSSCENEDQNFEKLNSNMATSTKPNMNPDTSSDNEIDEKSISSSGNSDLSDSANKISSDEIDEDLNNQLISSINSTPTNKVMPNKIDADIINEDSVIEFSVSQKDYIITDKDEIENLSDSTILKDEVPQCNSTPNKFIKSTETLKNYSSDESLASQATHVRQSFRELKNQWSSESTEPEYDNVKIDYENASHNELTFFISKLLNEFDSMKRDKSSLMKDIEKLQSDNSCDPYILQIKKLEIDLAQAKADACAWQQKIKEKEEQLMSENVRIRSDLTTRLERVTKQFENANKEKESMVIKFAMSEKDVLNAQSQKDKMEKKLKDMDKEKDNLLGKIKTLNAERAKICQQLDSKTFECNTGAREINRLKEELNNREVKIKWNQTKLKNELDANNELSGRLERALTKITKHEEELKAIKDGAEKVVKESRDSDEYRAQQLDEQLREHKAKLILERQMNENQEVVHKEAVNELGNLKEVHSKLVSEVQDLRSKVSVHDSERTESENLFLSLQAELNNKKQEISELNNHLAVFADVKIQFERCHKQLEEALENISSLESALKEKSSETESCRSKEAELLAFTDKLTTKNVEIQSQFTALQSKANILQIEHDEIKSELNNIKLQKNKIKNELSKEIESQALIILNLNKEIENKNVELTTKITLISDLENEICVLKRKHNNSVKDITREIHKLRKRLEYYENASNSVSPQISEGNHNSISTYSGNSSHSATPQECLSQGSRASSNTSLNTLEYEGNNGILIENSEAGSGDINNPLIMQQLLLERIDKLQKVVAKKSEKVEFLEEHISQIVVELKKKSRIIHHYIMREDAGALSSSASDTSKVNMIKHFYHKYTLVKISPSYEFCKKSNFKKLKF